MRFFLLFILIATLPHPALTGRAASSGFAAASAAESVQTDKAATESPLPLWPARAPGALGDREEDIPAIAPYLPAEERRNGTAVVVCPGGGYSHLAPHEGRDYAQFLNRAGITAFVLRYRLGSNGYRHPRMLEDAARAVRLVRARAGEWKLEQNRIGIMGSSAGGHLAATLLTHFDLGNPRASDTVERMSSRPDFGILCYPVISMGPLSHSGSREMLLGRNPDPGLVRQLSNELHVTAQTPPCFVWHTWEDKVVKVDNSLEFAAALNRNGIPFDLHVYQKGSHGIGLGDKPPFSGAHPWSKDLLFWLKARGLIQ
jgi:acetyl esterase/lipase